MSSDEPGKPPGYGVPDRFRTRNASNATDGSPAASWTVHVADSDVVRSEAQAFRQRVGDARSQAESGDQASMSSGTGDRVDPHAELLLLRDRADRIVASIQITPLDRVDPEIARLLDHRHLAVGAIGVSFSRHLAVDPGIAEAGLNAAMSAAIREHAAGRGWRYDLCLCSNGSSGSRRRLGYRPIGIRVDRESRSELEIYALDLDPRSSGGTTSGEAGASAGTDRSTI